MMIRRLFTWRMNLYRLAVGFVVLAIVISIRRSPLYPVLLAIRDAEPMAAAAGVRTSVVKVAMFGALVIAYVFAMGIYRRKIA